jgi:hypothetical protein
MSGDAFAARVGERVTLVGRALDAAAGAIVLLEDRPVYVEGLDAWPADDAGREVEITGTLAFQPGVPQDGPTVHGPSDAYAVTDATWSRR